MMMTQEQNSQLKKAKAKYELVKMMHGRKQATEQELADASEQVRRWLVAKPEQVEAPQKQVKAVFEYANDTEAKNSLPIEVKQIIDRLEAERTETDQLKKGLSMRLADIPEDVSAQREVDEILSLRDKWQELTDKIKFVYQFGKLPDAPEESIFDEHEFASALPNSKYELDKDIRNLSANLSKYRKRLDTQKSAVKVVYYETLIAQAELKIGVMRAKFHHL